LIWPDKDFRWSMLNDRIPLVDDVEPPKDDDETDKKLGVQVKIAIGASVALTVVLLVLWPIPMHLAGGVFTESGFTVWVAIEFIWAIVGGLTIIFLPGYELVRGFMGWDRVAPKSTAPLDVKIKEPTPIEDVYSPAKPKQDAALAEPPAAEVELVCV